MKDLVKLFEGEPKTALTTEGGLTVITVAVRHLRPFEAECADDTAVVLGMAAVGVAGWITYSAMEVTASAVALFLGALCGRPFTQMKLRRAFQVTSTVRFTEDSILLQRVQKAPSWEVEEGWRQFSRVHDHRFVLYQHDRAQAEKDEIDYQIRKSPRTRVARYFGESWYVALEYLGQRFDIAEVMGKRRADAILDRLTFCDKYMDSLVDVRKGLSIRPQDEWAGPSGSLPQ